MIATNTLDKVKSGESCIIVKVNGHGGFRHRIMEMGFVKGEKVKVIKNAPLLDPIEYQVMESHVSLRRSEAQNIEVVKVSEHFAKENQFNGMLPEDNDTIRQINEKTKTITVALVGNPNCGKTSLFNNATGLREKVGNYSGVTVDSKTGVFFHKGYTINLVDLPGTYSITEFTPEELYVREYITKQHPDVILNIVDSSNLERNFFLTTQLIDMNVKMVLALNMYDELEKRGNRLDYPALSKMFGFPIVPTTASKGLGINELLDSIIVIFEDKKGFSKHIHINYGVDIEGAIEKIKKKVSVNKEITDQYPVRYICIKLLENDSIIRKELSSFENYDTIAEEAERCRKEIEREYKEPAESVIADSKYGFIRGALQETLTINESKGQRWEYGIDTLLTNKWLGFPILLLFLWVMFQTTFTLGSYPQEWIDTGMGMLGSWIGSLIPAGILNDLIVNGIIAGVGGVIVFLPNIIILYLFISFLEDSGYMARAAFIMDKLMHKIGLHGKSFIPFLIGFGCGVPAIMATRTLENRKDRIITILCIPFMSCSARLPVYILFVSAFFSKYQGLILLSIYLIGIIFAIITALLLKKTAFKDSSDQFVMELPPYRIPTLRNTLIHVWDKSVQYIKKMGTVILAASIIIWFLGYFPQQSKQKDYLAKQITQTEADSTLSQSVKDSIISGYSLDMNAVQKENSYIGQIGHFMEPAIRPLGLDWKAGVSLITGLAAKEVVVSTLSVLYHADSNEGGSSENMTNKLKSSKHTSGSLAGQNVYTPLVAYCFMLFVLLYVPCFAAIAAIRHEAGRKWMWFTILYNTSFAWLVSFLVYQIGMLF